MYAMLIVALTGANKAALGPLPATTFPKYPTVVTPLATELDNFNVLEAYNQVDGTSAGLYRALRNDLYIFPTQNMVVAGSNTADLCTIGSQSTTRTFWVTSTTMLGSYPSKITAGTSSSYASGPVWVACTDISDALKCNGGAGYNNAATTKSHNVKNRLVIKAASTAQHQVAGDSSAYTWTWNQDLLLASMYHPAGSTVKIDGTQWCSKFSNQLNTTSYSAVEMSVSKGLSGRSKCSFLIQTIDD
jgi:hypothetical protein